MRESIDDRRKIIRNRKKEMYRAMKIICGFVCVCKDWEKKQV